MSQSTATLARSITWAGSKQSAITARLLVDRDLVDDCFRAYAYFRWADDVIDAGSRSAEERVAFIERQRALVERLYSGERPDNLAPEERIIADLIGHDRGENSGLQSFIRGFLAVLEFDAHRRGRLIEQDELAWYSACLGKSVTDAIQYFIGNDHRYPAGEGRYLAASAAHITHMLRDLRQDLAEGYINIPREVLETHGIDLEEVNRPLFQAWVRERVDLARHNLAEGKRYLDVLPVLRCKIAGYWYCARFEAVLDIIKRDRYCLRLDYGRRRWALALLKMIWMAIAIAVRHVFQRARILCAFAEHPGQAGARPHPRRGGETPAPARNRQPG